MKWKGRRASKNVQDTRGDTRAETEADIMGKSLRQIYRPKESEGITKYKNIYNNITKSGQAAKIDRMKLPVDIKNASKFEKSTGVVKKVAEITPKKVATKTSRLRKK